MPTPDLYGVDLQVDPTGDLTLSTTGDIATVNGPANVAQAVMLRMRTTIGDLPEHPDYGSNMPNMVGGKAMVETIAAALQAELLTMLQDEPRVIDAHLASYQSPADRSLGGASSMYGVTVTVIGGTQVTLSDLATPQLTDVSATIPVDITGDPFDIFDPVSELPFFQDQQEYDTLADLDQTKALIADLPGS